FHVGNERGPEHFPEVRMRVDRRNHVGEQGQGQPLEDLEDRVVAGEDLHAQDERGDRDHQPDGLEGTARDQRSAGGDGAQVGADVDGVRDQQAEDGEADEPPWELAPEAGPQPLSSFEGDPGAQLLDGGHQGKGEERGPEQPQAELAADLGVGPDAAGVVVTGAGDEARPQRPEQAAQPARSIPSAGRLVGKAWVRPIRDPDTRTITQTLLKIGIFRPLRAAAESLARKRTNRAVCSGVIRAFSPGTALARSVVSTAPGERATTRMLTGLPSTARASVSPTIPNLATT